MKGSILVLLRDVRLGDTLSTGATVVGIVHKEVREVCRIGPSRMGSATLVWVPEMQRWIRAGEFSAVQTLDEPTVFIGLIVVSNSQIELADETVVRDYLELCSPDAEEFYKGEVREWGMPHKPSLSLQKLQQQQQPQQQQQQQQQQQEQEAVPT